MDAIVVINGAVSEMAAVRDDDERARARRLIAHAQALAGDADGIRSLAATFTVEGLYDQMEMASLVALAELRQGDVSAAIEVLGSIDATRLLDRSGTIRGSLDREDERVRRRFVDRHLVAGEVGSSIELVLESADFDAFLQLRGPNGTLIEQDDDGGPGLNARIVATLPTDGEFEVLTYSTGRNETGDYALTWRISDPAGRHARIPYKEALILLSRARAAAGDVAGASAAAQRQDDREMRDRMLRAIAMAQVDAGDAQGARRTAGRIDDVGIHDGALTYIVFRQAAEGEFTDAQVTAQGIAADRDSGSLADVWPPLIDGSLVVSADLGSESVSFPELWECLNGFRILVPAGDMDSRSRALLGVAIAQHDAGEVPAAQRTVARLDAGRDPALAALSVMSVRAGDYEGARRISRFMRRGRNNVQAFIARAQAAAGELDGSQGSAGGGSEELRELGSGLGELFGSGGGLEELLDLPGLLDSTGSNEVQGVILNATSDAFAGDIEAAIDATLFLRDQQARDRFWRDAAHWQAFNGDAEGARETLLGVEDGVDGASYRHVMYLARGGHGQESVDAARRLFAAPQARVLSLVAAAVSLVTTERIRAGEWEWSWTNHEL